MKSRLGVAFLLLAGTVAAQLAADTTIHRVRVRVAFANGGCEFSTHVRMMSLAGPTLEGVANEQCVVEFQNVAVGTYRIVVSGKHVAETDAGTVGLDSGTTEFEVKVRGYDEPERAYGVPFNALVSTADLGVPARARKELDKANELVAKQELARAVQRLNKAIEVYPGYAVAYNNLAVIYARQGDRVREFEALQKAISLNDHFAMAYVNLGRMHITASDFPAAERALDKASTYDPTDPMTLVLLSYAEFMDQRFDEAIATSRKAHTLEKSHAFVHRVAARAFEKKRQGADAIAELELFLKEEPTGPRAEAARQELQVVQTVLRGQ